jgi:tetratricopeptide (TPR) repeat protein
MKYSLVKAPFIALMALAAISAPLAQGSYELALSEFKNGRYDEAARLFQELVDLSPSYDYGYYMLGLCHLKRGRHEEAALDFRTAIEFDGEKFEHRFGLAQAQKHGREYEAALATLNDAYALVEDDNRHAFHASRGTLHSALRRWQEAIGDLEIALALRQDNKVAMESLALSYYNVGRYNDSIPLLRAAIATSVIPASNYRLLAESLMAINVDDDDATSREAFEAAASYLSAMPDDPAASDLLGRAALAAGRFDEAIAAFSEVLVDSPANCSARINFARALLATGRADRAEKALAGREDCDTLQPDLYATLGLIQRTERRYEEALANYEKAYELLPATSSYQAMKEIRHNIAVQEFNLAAERQQADEDQRERELKDKIDRWNQFIEQE